MVTLTLTQTIAFLNSLPSNYAFVFTSNPANQTAHHILHTRPSTPTAYYSHATSGAEKAYTLNATHKKVTYSGSEINITTDTVTGLKRNFRNACGNNYPNALPQHQPNCATITNVFFTISGTTTAFAIPTGADKEVLFDYLEAVTDSPSNIGKFSLSKPYIRPIYLNDLSENITPFYRPRRPQGRSP